MSDNRFAVMAEDYDEMAPVMVPYYGMMQGLMVDYLEIARAEHPVVVDLGAGGGRFLERVLHCNPTARCYWVDFSRPFQNVAQKRLERYGNRTVFIHAELEDGWPDRLSEQPDYIFSMSAIHHLENHEKTALYKKCFRVLKSGGWMVNIDEMKTIYADAYIQSLHDWVRHGENRRNQLFGRFRQGYERWQGHFEEWKQRNLYRTSEVRSKGDDIHESFVKQMAWMKRLGFVNVDLFFKYQLWCIVGGQKPRFSGNT